MQPVNIDAGTKSERLRQFLENEIKKNKDKINIEVKKYNNSLFILKSSKNRLKDNKKNDVKFLENTSAILADFIIKEYEDRLLNKIIETNYGYFTNEEKNFIYDKGINILNNSDNSFINNIYKTRRKGCIMSKLMDYLGNSNSLILDGFVTFRLKDYIENLEEIADKSVNSYLIEREYNEFINLLKYFVTVQDPVCQEVHIYPDDNKEYRVVDGENRDLIEYCRTNDDDYTNNLNGDDLLINVLISVAPQKIIVHKADSIENQELLKTICQVFATNVYFE